jgi:hypothetical protein
MSIPCTYGDIEMIGITLLTLGGAAVTAYVWYKSHQLWMDDHRIVSIILLFMGFGVVINTALAIARIINGAG